MIRLTGLIILKHNTKTYKTKIKEMTEIIKRNCKYQKKRATNDQFWYQEQIL